MRTEEAVTAFLNSKLAQGVTQPSASWYRGILTRYAAMFPELPAEPEQVEAFLAAQKCGDESLFSYYKTLTIFHRWCALRHGAPNPMTLVPAPRRRRKTPRTLSIAEASNLFVVKLSRRDRALLCLLLDTGIRVSEAINLRVEDVKSETIIVNGKTGEREVPISQDTRRQILDLADSGYIFPGQEGHICRSDAYHIVHKALKASGLTGRKLGPHLLRHTLGRQWIAAGGDLVSLQGIMGHSSIQTTRIYVELDNEDIIRQHRKFSPLKRALAPVQGRLIDDAETYLRTVSREEG